MRYMSGIDMRGLLLRMHGRRLHPLLLIMRYTKKIALAGVFSALCFVFLFIGSVFRTLDLSVAAIGSIIVLIAFIELGKGWAFGVYAAATVISLLLLPYKTPAAVFALFAGFYPILKEPLNRIEPKWLSYSARILCFNIFLAALIFAGKSFFKVQDEFMDFGPVIYILANIVFLVYDIALERISVTYVTRIKPRIFGRHS